MDDFILWVEGAGTIKDFVIFAQVPHSKHAKMMAESLAHGGLQALLGKYTASIRVDRVMKADKRNHYIIAISGLKVGSQLVNEFFIALQLPKHANSDEAANAMVEEGISSYLGVFQKSVRVYRAGETIPKAFEALQDTLKMG